MSIFIVFRAFDFLLLLELESSFRPSSRMFAGEIWGFFRFFYMCLTKDWTQMSTNFHISTKVSLRSSYMSFLFGAAGLGLVGGNWSLGWSQGLDLSFGLSIGKSFITVRSVVGVAGIMR